MNTICFVLYDTTGPEAAETAENLREETGEAWDVTAVSVSDFLLKMNGNDEHPSDGDSANERPGKDMFPAETLFLTDCDSAIRALKEKGLPVCGYAHAGSRARGEHLKGVDYIVEEPAMIPADSYQKIYERAAGLPWTILETKRCVVRELTPEDAEAVLALYDSEARRFLEAPQDDPAQEREVLEAYTQKVYCLYGYGTWGIFSKENGQLIGRAGFEPYTGDDDAMHFGYLIHRDWRGQGYAFEACAAILRYGKEAFGFEKITAETAKENKASAALLKKLGFELRECDRIIASL